MDPITSAFVDWYRRSRPTGETPADASVAAQFYVDMLETNPELLEGKPWMDVFQALLDSHAVIEEPPIDDHGNVSRVQLH
jgi:hypothetical protein